ncbi:recombinase family protein [Bradyrhizobium diazoefficiens]|uniref:Serine recombinase n=1 Tax=Bradyrhizobium diazoefficiens TaxID=1355477 RepID=A0A809Z9V6_9BRAD|nr:recombinase family protein [Bradyrhizobium diazoefficiens]WLA70020.1 recombinase family protein [Bradyrhizobium diazoefficiens]BCE22381.1 serine recombinase [Bradyrhizobium diazoefficiens]BCE48645.1 serine recombinase [Bradyrhizobium diazoefficiens]BCE92160.1 serine recombinase [Bradyrhizobium diazoefficiens]BCF27087.1 serine recombinase [Bradyrhizobium diazoefficiens]
MVNALVLHKSYLPKAQRANRAAQYVRMSTDYQQYSIANQMAVIAAYAQRFELEIVRTYRDDGKSGLHIKNRKGLLDMIDDVQCGRADFGCILVYDVSRWGRFQDVDESAYYEFLCKRNGVRVEYCAELFKNDGSFVSGIAKNLKRGMAAEWSRERSEKVYAGACLIARMGFRLGGRPGIGLRRELIDVNGRSRGVMQNGERKFLQTDRVMLRPGPPDEVELVRSIFRQFVIDQRGETKIARRLNAAGIRCPTGRPWSEGIIRYMLANENYIGNLLYDRHSCRLREYNKPNPREQWIRKVGAFESVISPELFAKARAIIAARKSTKGLSNEEMLKRLRILLKKKGRLSRDIISDASGVPSPGLYQLRFGSLRNAYRLIGYVSTRDCEYIDSRDDRHAVIEEHALKLGTALATSGEDIRFDQVQRTLEVRGLNVSLRVARSSHDGNEKHSPTWTVERGRHLPPGLIVGIRLNASNLAVRDYFLMPASKLVGRLRFTESSARHHGLRWFGSVDDVIRAVKRHLGRAQIKTSRVTVSAPGV